MKNVLALGAALTLLAGAAAAQTPSNSNAVFVGGTPIMRVRLSSGNYSPEQRATAIQERLNEILAHGPIRAADVTVAPLGAEAVVRVQGRLLFTADAATAKYNGATPLALAKQWAANMRTVLPGLTRAK